MLSGTTTADTLVALATTTTATHPSVKDVNPNNGATNVSRATFIACDVSLIGSGVNSNSLKGHVTLTRASDGTSVAGTVNTSGGGDSIVFTPSAALAANTKYSFKVSSSVTDTAGHSFTSFTSSFTTGTAGGPTNSSISFDKVKLSNATGHHYTVVLVGPDHRLYAADDQGDIFRYNMNSDGTLGTMKSIQTVRIANKGPRLIAGMAFDPASTSTNLILWVDSGYPSTSGSPDWSGKVSKLSGTDLSHYQDAVIDLPRSFKDHLTEGMAFGPDGALYISQASMTAMGAPDPTWGMRSEHLLSAAILRLDTKAVGTKTLDVKTPDGGGKYNPFAAGAPLTIYADGTRNAYDIVWTHDGDLFAPVNGSASGGNTPAGKAPFTGTRIDQATNGPYTGPAVPAEVDNVPAQDDYLFNIVKGGYYGHPNPTRNEFVLNGGNPTSGKDPAEVTQYPVGTKPDRNYRGFAWDFGKFESADGIIEYRGSAFGGKLDGDLMAVQYSGGDDVAVLSRSGTKITGEVQNYTGMTGFTDPLGIAEDMTNGNIYIAEYGGERLTLLRPHKTSTTSTPAVALAPATKDVVNKSTSSSLVSQVLE